MKTAHKNRLLDLGGLDFPTLGEIRTLVIQDKGNSRNCPGTDMSVSSSSRGIPVGGRWGAG